MAAEHPQWHLILTALALSGFMAVSSFARADPVADLGLPEEQGAALPLYLAVFINGHDTTFIAQFAQHSDGRFSSPASELQALGFRLADDAPENVFLDELPGVSYAYDEQKQTMALMAEDSALVPKTISGNARSEMLAPQPGFGSVLNYGLYATTPDSLLDSGIDVSGASLSLDSNIYTPWGVLTNTGVIRTQGLSYEGATAIRTSSQFSHADQRTMTIYNLGDVISSSLPWTRSIRLGGGQVKRDFGLRDDIVTTPLLTAKGSAAVPSTVDVYIDNVRTYTGSVDPGPFLLTDVPVIDKHGDARIVLRDASGRESEVSVPFYASQSLLKQGMLDYSLEAGVARNDIYQDSFSYGSDPLASASARYGLTDRLTLEAHAEGKSDLMMGGAGITTVLFNTAEATIAAGGSVFDGEAGLFAYGRLSTELMGFEIDISSFRSFGEFADLAYATGIDDLGAYDLDNDYTYLEPARAMDVISLALPSFFDESSVSLSLIHASREDDENLILSGAYSRSLDWRDASLRVNGFMDFADDSGLGLAASFSMPLGGNRYFDAGVQQSRDGNMTPSASLQKPLDNEIGSYGYRVSASGSDIYGDSGASASYRSSFGVAEARVRADDGKVSAAASFDGALVIAGGGVFASNTIYDSFAVVDAGVPDVPVMLHNRPAARTGKSGKALVTGLRSYAENKVSIDVANLPVDVSVSATDEIVIPARRSGVSVKFNAGVRAAALVIVRDAAGNYMAPGAVARLNGGDAENYVGYDGQLWLEDVAASNSLVVETENGTCSASFSYSAEPGKQVTIDSVECK